ncbi:MAG: choice-of-anchor B family protein, partial [bacterium]
MSLLENVNLYSSYNDCWGYSAPDGREYAIIGTSTGTSIVDVTEVNNIVEVAFIPGLFSTWRDMKTYQNYLYVVTEAAPEMQIIDLSALPNSASLVATYTNFETSPHNIYIDMEAGILYAIEDFNFSNPVRIISLNDPLNPIELSTLGSGLGTDAHDAFAQDSILYVAEGINGSLGIFDVTDPKNPALLQRVFIPVPGYVHNVWVTEDNRYMISTEETSKKTVKMWDIQDLDIITLVSEYLGESLLAHNAFLRGNYAYISHYQSGLKILDITDPTFMIEVGNFDTFPNGNSPGSGGAWGTYPFTQNGSIFISDMQTGLYVVEFNGVLAYRLTGTLRDAQTAKVIENGWIEIVESGIVVRSDINGVFKTGIAGGGPITLRIAAYGYRSQELMIDAVEGVQDTIDISMELSPLSSIVGTVTNQFDEPLENVIAHLLVSSVLLEDPFEISAVTNSEGQFVFDSLLVSDGNFVSYDSLWLDPIFPFVPGFSGSLIVEKNAPTLLDFQLEPADILIVNDDPNGNYGDFYKNELVSLNKTYHEWKTTVKGTEIPVSSIDQLNTDIIIWFTGDADTDVLTLSEQDSLAQFLENGGKLFLTGQNIAESLNAQSSTFLTGHLRVEYGGNSVSFIMNAVQENPMAAGLNPIAIMGGDGADNQTSKDILLPLQTNGAKPALTYIPTGQVAAVTIENETSGAKAVFLGFGFEGIVSDAPLASSRSDVLQHILDWFSFPVKVENQYANIYQSFRLEQNFPNPFNPSTTIRFVVPTTVEVTLKIFDTLGREVETLVNNKLDPGEYEVEWNATGMASGV